MGTELEQGASGSDPPRPGLPICLMTTDTLREFIKKDANIVLRTNFGDFLSAQNQTHDTFTDLLQVLLEQIEDPAKRASKLNERGSDGSCLLYHVLRFFHEDATSILEKDDAIIPNLGMEYVDAGYVPETMLLLVQLSAFCSRHKGYEIELVGYKIDGYFEPIYVSSVSLRALLDSHSLWAKRNEMLWVHVPSTNGLAIMAAIRAARKLYDINCGRFLVDEFRPPAIDPGDPLLNYRDATYQAYPDFQGLKCFMIVFPYLRLDSIQRWKDKRGSDKYTKRKVLDNLLGTRSTDFTLYLERTLDEVYYPSLRKEALDKRNSDQTVSRALIEEHKTDEEDGGNKEIPLLVVPEMWLWKLGNILISAWSGKIGDHRMDIRRMTENDFFTETDVAILLATMILSFGERRIIGSEEFPPALDIFEREVVAVLSSVGNYLGEGKPSSISFIKERRFLHILSDIRSELVMITHVLKRQKKVFDKLVEDGKESRHRDTQGKIDKAQDALDAYQEMIRKIDGDAERTEKTIQDMLELKRVHASIKDTHNSLLLSTAIIGFAVITIIFAPLAFLAGLFALKIDGFQNLRVDATDPESAYDGTYMGSIFIGSEILTVALTGIAVLAAFWYIDKLDRHEEQAVDKRAKEKAKERQSCDEASSQDMRDRWGKDGLLAEKC